MPYRKRPPIFGDFSYTITLCPIRRSCCAAAKPAGPDPTMAIFFPVRICGIFGMTQFSSKAFSMIANSICLMVTGLSFMAKVHAVSHGAGQRRPVNSGKLFVISRRLYASRH